MDYEIYSIEWEKIEDLPELNDTDYEHVLEYARGDGPPPKRLRIPFIRYYLPDGSYKKIYLGA